MVKKIENTNDVKKLANLALYAGEILIKSGAEIYRAEDTVKRICESKENIDDVNAYALPLALFVSITYKGETFTTFKRVEPRGTNLDIIDKVNTFSRNFVADGGIDYNEGMEILKEIETKNILSNWQKNLAAAIAGAFFTILFGGNFKDFVSTFFITAIMSQIFNKVSNLKLSFVINNFIGAFIVSLLAVICIKLNLATNIDKVIIGGIMILVPGVEATNASRETMNGDFLSGVIGFTKAIFLATSIALGAGVVLKIFM